jgi:hypothetical protein
MIVGELAAGQTPTTTAGTGGSAAATEPAATTQAAVSQESQQQIDRLVGAYLEVGQLLAGDKVEGVTDRMAVMLASAKALGAEPPLKKIAGGIAGAAGQKASSLAEFRSAFKTLSTHVIELVRVAPTSSKVAAQLYAMHCPIVNADWRQRTRDVANPYDSSMTTCGSVTATIKAVSAEK